MRKKMSQRNKCGSLDSQHTQFVLRKPGHYNINEYKFISLYLEWFFINISDNQTHHKESEQFEIQYILLLFIKIFDILSEL